MQEKKIVWDEMLALEMSRTSTAFRSKLERQMLKSTVHGGQMFVLLELWKKDGLRQVDLAERLGVSPPTINKMIVGMVKAKLVINEKVEDDARSTRIFLTHKSNGLREKIEELWEDLETTCRSALTEPERYMLMDMLVRIRAKLNGIEVVEED
ncbi:MAG: winged helix-turn-helix transcriptional regulator [Acidobacteria bacterium]|nr:winged helix-turn-helix transcriptional regulator [Acidobacteriota bacterium]